MQIKSTMTIAIKNHKDPAKISLTVTSSFPLIPCKDDLTVNTFIPKGGVIMPVSIAMIITRPNHTISYPISRTIGHISGVVKSSMDVESRIHPNTIRISMKIRIIPMDGTLIPFTKELSVFIIPHIDKVLE